MINFTSTNLIFLYAHFDSTSFWSLSINKESTKPYLIKTKNYNFTVYVLSYVYMLIYSSFRCVIKSRKQNKSSKVLSQSQRQCYHFKSQVKQLLGNNGIIYLHCTYSYSVISTHYFAVLSFSTQIHRFAAV